MSGHTHHPDPAPGAVPGARRTVIDPVCGMTVAADGPLRFEHAGTTYVFCSAGCLAKFRADPAKYLTAPQSAAPGLVQLGTARRTGPRPGPASAPMPAPAPPSAKAEGVEYTCPMHPEVRQIGPGSCPKCGMALEPSAVTAEVDEDPELRDMTRRFWVSAALSLPLLVLAMADMFPGSALGSSLPMRTRRICGRRPRQKASSCSTPPSMPPT